MQNSKDEPLVVEGSIDPNYSHMDDNDRVHFVADSAATALLCDNCGSSSCFVNEIGAIICVVCGTQSQDVRNIEGEYDGSGLMRTRGGAALVRRTKRGPRVIKPVAKDTFSTTALLGAMQYVLNAQVEQLINICSCPRIMRDSVSRVWFSYLERWALLFGTPPPAVVVHGHLATGTHQDYWAALRSAGHIAPPRCPPLSFALLLCVSYAACRLLCLPILPHDLCSWVRNGTLAYLNSYSALPLPMQASVSVARALFTPTGAPSPQWIARMTDVLCASVEIVLPPVNFQACAARLINLLHLPAAAVSIAFSLCALDMSDRAQQSVPPGPRSREPLDMLRRAVKSELPGSYVAGLVFSAVRLLPHWRGWVAAHLKTASGRAAGGLAAQCACAAYTVNSRDSSVGKDFSGGLEMNDGDVIEDASRTPAFVPHPDVLLPWTTTQTVTVPRDLIGAYVRFVGSRILHGGDFAPGRGEAGYEAGRYGPAASVKVTVADGRIADDIARRVALRVPAGFQQAADAHAQAQEIATGSLLSLLNGEGDNEDTEAIVAALAAPREIEVSLGSRKDNLPVRLGSVIWRQKHMNDVRELSSVMRAWGEEDVGAEAQASSSREFYLAHGLAGAALGKISVAESAEVQHIEASRLSSVPLADSITVYTPTSFLKGLDPCNTGTDREEDFTVLLASIGSAVDASTEAIVAQADALLLLLQYYSPLR